MADPIQYTHEECVSKKKKKKKEKTNKKKIKRIKDIYFSLNLFTHKKLYKIIKPHTKNKEFHEYVYEYICLKMLW